MHKIGFIGVGIMGKSMVRNLMKAGFELHIFARTKAKVEDVIGEGAIFHESIKECVDGCEAVITIVGFPQDVEEVYFDTGNILDSAKEGAYLIDMTTTSPMLAKKIWEAGSKQGFRACDRRRYGSESRYFVDSCWWQERGLRGVYALIYGNGNEHQLSGRGRLRAACQAGEPDYDCGGAVWGLRGFDICEGEGA